jgi:phage baseplate assembly protein W
MGNINIDLDFASEIEENTHLYKDVDIKFLGDDGSKSKYIAQHTDVEAILQGLTNLFTWEKGERILLPEFGINLKSYLYEQITPDLISDIRKDITIGINSWEPRVALVDIEITDGDLLDAPHTLYVTIQFKVPSINDEILNFNTVISNN